MGALGVLTAWGGERGRWVRGGREAGAENQAWCPTVRAAGIFKTLGVRYIE